MALLRHIVSVCIIAFKRIYHEKYAYRASALSFATLLGFVPLIAVLVYIMTLFPIFTELNNSAKNYIINNLVPASSDGLIQYLNQFSYQAIKMPTLGILFLFLTVIMLVITINDTFSAIWHRRKRVNKWFFLILYPIMLSIILCVIGLNALLTTLMTFIFTSKIAYINFCISLVTNTIILVIFYMNTASVKISLYDLFFGGFIAALLLELARILFTSYVIYFTNYNLIYGTLATLPIFLMWLYIFWFIIIYGGYIIKINHLLKKFPKHPT